MSSVNSALPIPTKAQTREGNGFSQPIDRQQAGFTIIELMIATVVFSTILVLISVGLLQVSRLYYKGITTTRTQQTARGIMDDIARSIQFSGGNVTSVSGSNPSFFCVDNKRYSFFIGKQLVDGTPDTTIDQTNHALIRDTSTSCGSAADMVNLGNNQDPVEMMAVNMRLSKLIVCVPGMLATVDCPNPPATGSNLYTVTVGVVSGENDILDASKTRCKGGRSGGQFCAVSELSTTVEKRI